MNVGIRELKAKLSEYVERAARGEIISVTRRGRLRAQLTPVPGNEAQDPALERGIREGWITPRKRPPARIEPLGLKSRMSVEELLAEDRGE